MLANIGSPRSETNPPVPVAGPVQGGEQRRKIAETNNSQNGAMKRRSHHK